jgi:glutamyl-tRNA reductase
VTSLVVVGLNYRTSPVGLLERLSIADEELPKALHQLLSYEHVLEGVALSTCNRVEVAALVSRFHGGAQDLRNFLSEFCHVAPEDFADHLYTYHDDGAARHLFRVAAGLDSMVVGESEILGQVRRAFQVAAEEGVTGRVLGHAFRRALSVGKRARTETAIARNPASFSTAAVELARRAFGTRSLGDKRVLVVGAGTMGKLSLKALVDAGTSGITVVSRSDDAARNAAALAGGDWRPLADLEVEMARADIMVTSTTSPGTVIERVQVERAVERRQRCGPLFIVDVAVPRDVDPSVASLDSVILRDIDDLRAVVEAGLGSRRGEITHVDALIGSEIDRFVEWQRADELSPAIAALVASADQTRARELERAVRHLGELSPAQREAIDHLSRRIVAKLLHAPIRNVRRKAGSNQGYLYLQTLRELFELDDDSTS